LTACLLAAACGSTGTPRTDAGTDTAAGTDPDPTAPSDEVVVLALAAPGPAFGDLFRSVNLDAGKGMTEDADYDLLVRLMCPDTAGCTPGAVRFWDKTWAGSGRYALEQPISNDEVLSELHERGFDVMWTLQGTPAFLSPSCSGCTVEVGADTYHLVREAEVQADDPRNPLGVDVACTCTADKWYYDVPTTDAVAGVDWLDYLESTLKGALALFEEGGPELRVALWSEPDTGHWNGNQSKFTQMWCASQERMAQVLAERGDVLLGGPDMAWWSLGIGDEETPLLQEIQETCGDGRYDFLTYHHYNEPGRLLLEESVSTVRSWGSDPDLMIDVGEYAASLSGGVEETTTCDPTAVAPADGETPAPQGEDDKAVLCDHRGAAEDVAMAASMAAQDHGRLYRFEVWDWGATDMVESRLGLLTANNLPKPTATAFWMLSHLQGDRVAVVNQLDGAHPYHLLAAREGDTLTVVVTAQDRTVTEQFVRGLLAQGLGFAEDVAPELAGCAAFSSDDPETSLSELAVAGTTAAQLVEQCPALDDGLAEDLAVALAYAAPRVGQVGEPFTLAIEAEGLDGSLSRHRIDAWHNTYAETLRRWPDGEYADASFDFEAAEEALWGYLTTPIDEVEAAGGRLVIEVRPDSVTMLRGEVLTR